MSLTNVHFVGLYYTIILQFTVQKNIKLEMFTVIYMSKLGVKKTFLLFQTNNMGCLNYKINHQLVTEFRQKRSKQEIKYYVLKKGYCFQQQDNSIARISTRKEVVLIAACQCNQLYMKFEQHYFLTFPFTFRKHYY